MNYTTRYVHKIRSSPKHTGPVVTLNPHHLADRRALGAALRVRLVLCAGQAIRAFRVEPDGKVVVFPQASVWHAIILEPVES